LAAGIEILNGAGGNGNDNDTMLLNGSGWASGETISTITVDGKTTTFKATTVDSNGRFNKLMVIITQPITSIGWKDVIVTGSSTGATTFTDYWYVSEGCGFNDIYRRGEIDPEEYNEDLLIRTIEEARFYFNGRMRGSLSTDDFPFTLGDYPPTVIQIITDICVALIYQRKGTSKDYKDMAQPIWDAVNNKIDMIRRRKIMLYYSDGTLVANVDKFQKTDPDYRSFGDVITVDD
jgi:hypothetical protein